MNWKGVIPAITTNLDAAGAIDHAALGRHCEWLIRSGCTGIVCCGSLGEAATVEAGVDPARETFDLGEDELEQLRSELEAADLGSFDEPDEPSGCADCYVYEVASGDDTISYDESQQVPEAMAALVAHLERITADHYPADATEPPIVN